MVGVRVGDRVRHGMRPTVGVGTVIDTDKGHLMVECGFCMGQGRVVPSGFTHKVKGAGREEDCRRCHGSKSIPFYYAERLSDLPCVAVVWAERLTAMAVEAGYLRVVCAVDALAELA